jgi:hypothetical protein
MLARVYGEAIEHEGLCRASWETVAHDMTDLQTVILFHQAAPSSEVGRKTKPR